MSAFTMAVERCDQCGRFIARGDEHWTRGCHYAAGGWPEEELTVVCGRCHYEPEPQEAQDE